MKMTMLQQLHKSMLAIKSDMQQFQISMGAVGFDCLFSTRDKPNFTLALTSRGESPKFFIFQVKMGYEIAPYFDGFYGELAKVLNTGTNTGKTLMPKDFLDQLNNKIPATAKSGRSPSSSEIIRLRPDITEDRDRPHFDTWIFWTPEGGRHPSSENLHKTKMVMGLDALEFSIRENASSKWSAIDLNRNWDDEIKK